MNGLTYATVCSGVECMSVAAIGLPLKPVFFSEIEPFPCAVLKHRFPHVPNLGDMSRITINEKGEITNGRTTVALPAGGLDILAGGTPCFTAGTMVLTERGYRPIETLCVGDRVVSGDGIICTVEAVGSKMARHGLFKAIGRPPVDCTPNHPMMCVSMKRDNRRSSDTYASLIPVGDFEKSCAENSVGKYIGRRAVRNEMYNVGFPKCYDCDCGDIMELAGWYLGDGYIRRTAGKNKKCVVLTLCSHAKIERFNKVFDSKLNYSRFKDGRIQISCTALADWLSFNFGEHLNGKRIPYWCYDRENTHRLLRGYEATDGHDYGTHFKFTTTSKSLAYGIADLYNNAAISFHKVNPVGTICGRKVNQKDYWEVQAFKNETPRTKWVKDRYASKVRSYNGTNGLVRVYNITVSEDHTYIADGLYTHNCQDVSNAGKRRGMQEGSGTRSSLAFEFVRLIRELRPRYVIWENVAGVLSDESFPKFLCAIADCGYGVAYRTLDAQFVRCADIDLPDGGVVCLERAVPQRRRRVWVVGCAGEDLQRASEILFEPQGMCGDRPPRRVTGQGTAKTPLGRARLPDGVVGRASAIASNIIGRSDRCGGNGLGAKDEVAYTLDTIQPQGVAVSVATKQQSMTATVECGATLEASCYKEPQSVAVASGFNPCEPGGVKSLNLGHAGTLLTGVDKNCVCEVYENHQTDARTKTVDVAPTMGASHNAQAANNNPLVAGCFVKVSHAPSSATGNEASVAAKVLGVFDMGARKTGAGTDTSGVSPTVLAQHGTDPHAVCLGFKSRPSKKAYGIGAEREISPTVTTQFDGTVCFGINANGVTKTAQMPCREECAETLAVGHQGGVVSFEPGLAKREGEGHRFSDEVVSTPRAKMGDNLPAVATVDYVVRRLTPTECERLMGLPDGWTLPAFAPGEITDTLVDEFRRIHDTFGSIMAGYAGNPPPKPKTAAWVRTWLERIANPKTCPDAPRYKACGNGWATNQPRWILMNLLERDSPGWQFELRVDGDAPAFRPASGADVYNGQVHDEVADTIGANSGDGTTAGGKVIV